MAQIFGEIGKISIYSLIDDCECKTDEFYKYSYIPGIGCIKQILNMKPINVLGDRYVLGKKVRHYPIFAILELNINGHLFELFLDDENGIRIDSCDENLGVIKLVDLNKIVNNQPDKPIKSARKK